MGTRNRLFPDWGCHATSPPPTLLLHALPTRHTVSPQTTCQVNPTSLSCSLSGLQSAMRLVANTGVHCIQHGFHPLAIKLSGSHCDHGCCSLSRPLSPPLNSQNKMKDSASLTFRASLQRAQHLLNIYCLSRAVFLTLTLPSWGEGWHLLSVEGRGGSYSIHVRCGGFQTV